MPQGAGSGFIWDTDGHIVTNFHVIRGARDLKVTLGDQSAYDAAVVGYDEDKDVAVLKIDAPPEKLRPLQVGASSSLLVGQKVLAIGNPFGFSHSLSTGVVSGVGRDISSANGRPIRGVIQTDAAVNPGNSGGPLLDSAGRLVGVNTAIYSTSGASSGVGFAIPVDTVRGIVDQLIKTGKVTRPVLGVTIAPDGAFSQLGIRGVVVVTAPRDSPAGQAGVRSTTRDEQGRLILGDVIVGLDGKRVRDSRDLFLIIDEKNVGDRVKVTLSMSGIEPERDVYVKLGEKTTRFTG